jgi:hypothetical protein
MKVHGQQIRAMTAGFTHEQVHAILVRHDEAMTASEPCGRIHDYRHARLPATERAAVVNSVIGCLA